MLPDAETFAYVGNTRTIEEKLLHSELDIAIVEGDIRNPDLISLSCIRDYLVLGCSGNIRLPGKRSFTFRN